MRLYRLYNLTEQAPASGLHFLKREGAEKYKDLVRWPYAESGRWPLPGGREIPLKDIDFYVEPVDLPVVVEPALGLAVMEREGVLGTSALLPGDCFDPKEWLACAQEELEHPFSGPLLEEARRRLRGKV